MKVFEILRDDIKSITEEQIESRLKAFNWKFEFSEDFSKIAVGTRELEALEKMIYEMWKSEPEKAIHLWWKYSDAAPSDKTIVPSFIYRLEALENESTEKA